MSLARQPRDEPPRRPRLRLVSTDESSPQPSSAAVQTGSPARGIVWGLAIAIVGFWAPLAVVAARVASR